MVSAGAGERYLSGNAAETNAVAAVFRHHVFSGFRRRDAHIIDLAGQDHLVQGLLDLSREIELEHEGRVRHAVVTFSVGSATEEDIVIKGYFNGFHWLFHS